MFHNIVPFLSGESKLAGSLREQTKSAIIIVMTKSILKEGERIDQLFSTDVKLFKIEKYSAILSIALCLISKIPSRGNR